MGTNILLVEDNPGDARLIQVLLAEEAGSEFHLTHVERLTDACELVKQEEFACVLLDLSLPDSQGLETVEGLRKTGLDVPVVVLSGLDNEEVALAALQSGAQDYLTKGRADGMLLKRSILYAIERHRTRKQLLLAEAAFKCTDTGIMVMDAGWRVIRVNPAFTRVTGYDPDEVIGHKPQVLSSGVHDAEFYDDLWASLDANGAWEGEIWNRRKNGEVYPEWLRINAVADEQGGITGYVAILSDITHRKKAETELLRQATRDPLTGLANRQLFMHVLEDSVERASSMERACAVLFIDLDGFKEVNDRWDHAVGDELLKEVARRLRGTVRVSDEVARLGGDEFTVVLTEVRETQDAARVAEKIVAAVAEPYTLSAGTAEVSASVGIAVYPADATAAEDLVRCADQAMYSAKRAGKNRYRFYSAAHNTPERPHFAVQ
ncbi:PAC domain protein [Caenispirillum salinarum AK4]|uniref:PAC domain protein n=1 Tax=Caenispirillum salinarum AK4 TaxID=1238182 RepID=K9HA86_9PROT|nr:diguanylate cyclase [Caenispirillum salinarum]EKV27513.1 PAC domain protein [Caenispirillum salinarum AK4]